MVDFNTKKNILKKLRKVRSENKLLWLPCVIAAAFVKLWYGTACRIGMALSDKNGNFLGIKMPERKSDSRKVRRQVRRQDDIVYVKKPFIGRIMSVVLAAAFVLMVAPELSIDLGVRASAADITDSIKVKKPKPDGSFEYEYYYIDTIRSNNDDTYLFRTTDYNDVRGYKVSNITYDIADRAVRVHWDYDHTGKYGILRGFHIKLIQTSTNGTTTVYEDDIFQSTSRMTMINNSVANKGKLIPGSSLNVEINPIVDLSEWLYRGRLTADEEVEEINIAPADTKFQVTHETANGTNVAQGGDVSFNTGFSEPALIINDDEEDFYGTQLTLTWDDGKQMGGTSPDAIADGYVIYRKEGNNPYIQYKTVLRTAKEPDILDNTYVDDVQPGVQYQYFIEAYRYAWNASKAYNPNHDGIISSSGSSVSSDAPTKFSLYQNYARTVYVAPREPSLEVTPMPGKNTIDIKPSPGYGSYSGVYVFRTTGVNEFTVNSPGVNLNGDTFGKWFYTNGNIRGNPYGIEYVGHVSGLNGTVEDKNIIEGQDYYYYGVSYLTKYGNNKLYSQYISSEPSKLSVKVNTPTGLNVKPGDGQMTISWDSVPGALGYELEIKQISSHDPTLPKNEYYHEVLEMNSKTSYPQLYLYNDDKYEYKVRAYIQLKSIDKDGNELDRTYSEQTKPVTATVGLPIAPPANVTATTTDETVVITWEPSETAQSYTLHFTNNTDPSKSGQIDGIKGNSYTHRNLTNGEEYVYHVVAHKLVHDEDKYSTSSNSYTIKVGQALTVPQNLKTTTKDGEITITWDPVSGASGYLLYFKNLTTGESDTYNITKPPFTHTGLKNGDRYEYKVQPYKTMRGSGKNVPGPWSLTVTQIVGNVLDAPKDFTATTNDGKVDLKWTAVKGAEGYIIHASSGGRYYQFDVSKVTYTHSDLSNGDVWTYYVTAYKTVNGTRTYSNPSEPRTVTIGISLNSAVDLTATAGNRQIDLKWTAVKGAEGYVVYLYNSKTMEFEPITLTSKTSYSHVGLKNGKQYTYMVAPYKNINGKRYYGDYSLSVTAIPTTGSITDIDHELKVKGTAPYGISHGEYIKATSNHGAFDESVDVYFTTNRKSTQAVKDVLKNYANGLSSFIIYPFDISIYRENTHIEVDPADGYTVTITMPVPDRLIAYRDYITVVHIGDGVYEAEEMNLAEDWLDNYDRRLEVLPCAIVDIDNVWCVQFKCSDFSPFALVIYKEHIQDVASGGGLLGGDFADTFNSGVLLFTALPDIMPHNRKLRIVQSGSKRYRIKSVTRR